MKEKIEFSFTFEEHDFVESWKLFVFTKKFFVVQGIYFIITVALGLFCILDLHWYLFGIGFMLLMFGITVFRILKGKKLDKKNFRINKLNYNARYYEIDNYQIIQKRDDAYSEHKWDEILKVKRNKKVIQIYFSLNAFLLLPIEKIGSDNLEKLDSIMLEKGLIS